MIASQLIGNRFRIDDFGHDKLGRGGMGAVDRATDTLTGELVAAGGRQAGRQPGR